MVKLLHLATDVICMNIKRLLFVILFMFYFWIVINKSTPIIKRYY